MKRSDRMQRFFFANCGVAGAGGGEDRKDNDRYSNI